MNETTDLFENTADAEPGTPAAVAPTWGTFAPKGGKTVVTRALKDGANVPLFLGQTLINSLRDLGYNSTTSALCEHVDNAIQAEAKEIRIYFRQRGKQPRQQIDVMVYDNGKGMAPNVLKVAMAFGGSTVYDNRSGIGRYGMGMKAAAINIARAVDVISWQEPNAFYTMTLDVDAIGKDRNNMIGLPDAQLSDTLPSEIASMLTEPMDFPKKQERHDLLADDDTLYDMLGRSGTIVFMPNCDRLSMTTARGLVDHATKEMARVYRRFIDKGLKIFVNNRELEAFDPTYWMLSARHTKVEGITQKRSSLVDSWEVNVPITESSDQTATVRVRMFLLPIEEWAVLSRDVLRGKLQVYEDHTVSYMRNGREIDSGPEPRLKIKKHHTNNWFRVEIEFTGESDEAFGVAVNKQGVRIREYAAELILDRLQPLVVQVKKKCAENEMKHSAARQVGQCSQAEKLATEADPIQSAPVAPPPTDTPEQRAALEENLKGLAVSVRQENETDEQAIERVKATNYLTEYRHQEYAPFYETEYQFGKHILRVNTAHPFFQKVWQPLADAAKQAALIAGPDDGEDGTDVGSAVRKALLGYQLLLLSLARTQTQMTGDDPAGEKTQLFRNLRKSWSDVLETQLMHV